MSSELLKTIGLEGASVKELEVTAIERVARFIAALAPLFLIVGLLGLYIEFKMQGAVMPGVIGVLCLAIFFWGHHIAGLAGMEDILIFLLGMALLAVELLFIPGFGAIGFLGIGLMLWALLDAMIEKYPGGPWYPAWPAVQMPLLKLSVSLIGSAVAAMFLGKFLPETRLFKNIGLETTTSKKDGYAASEDSKSLIGLEGRALSPLARPAPRNSATGDWTSSRAATIWPPARRSGLWKRTETVLLWKRWRRSLLNGNRIMVELFAILIIAGLFLIGAEIFLPGGIIGFIGGMCLLAAVIVGFAAFGIQGGILSFLPHHRPGRRLSRHLD